MDELNRPQEIPSIAFEDIPTPEEHAREVRWTFAICGSIAFAVVCLSIAGIATAIQNGVPLQTIALCVPIIMGVAIATFAIGYGIPVGLVSLRRLEIAYRMGYFGAGQGRKATAAMEKIADRVDRETKPLPSARRPVHES